MYWTRAFFHKQNVGEKMLIFLVRTYREDEKGFVYQIRGVAKEGDPLKDPKEYAKLHEIDNGHRLGEKQNVAHYERSAKTLASMWLKEQGYYVRKPTK